MTKRKVVSIAVAAWVFASAGAPAAARDEVVSTANDQQSVAVTIYNDDLALIKDTRRVVLQSGANQLAWREVSAQMRPETAFLRNAGAPAGFSLLEQNFDFDLLTPEKLLEKYVGREVRVIRSHPTTGAESRENAIVLSTNGGVVLRFPDRIETGIPGRLAFPGVPDTLRDKPTLVISLINPQAGAQTLELSYLSAGLSWRADYVGELNAKEDRMDLNAWVTLTNQSGAAYPNARLQLVAGDVNRVVEAVPPRRAMMTMSAKSGDVAEMQQEALFEYHLYTLPRPTSLAQNQTKQVALLSAAGVPVRKEYRLEGAPYYFSNPNRGVSQKLKVGVFVEFLNKGDGLGVPLPKGVVRIYKKDRQGNAQFVGEDRIDHTPKDETVQLKLGDAFDVTAERKQTDFQKIAGGDANAVFESAHEIEIKNAKTEPVTVIVREPMAGDWTVLSASLPHTKVASGTAEWRVKVPAEGRATLNYRVRVKY